MGLGAKVQAHIALTTETAQLIIQLVHIIVPRAYSFYSAVWSKRKKEECSKESIVNKMQTEL